MEWNTLNMYVHPLWYTTQFCILQTLTDLCLVWSHHLADNSPCYSLPHSPLQQCHPLKHQPGTFEDEIYCNISKIDVLLTFHLPSDNVPREVSIPFAARRNGWGKWICGRFSWFLKEAKVSLMPEPGKTIPVRSLLNENRWLLIAGEMVSIQIHYTIRKYQYHLYAK